MNIFDRLDRGTDFQINVAVKLHQEFWGVGNNVFVGENGVIFLDSATIVRSGILWIAIILHHSLGTERLWEVLFALSILQAMLWTIRAMQHEFFHSLIELRVNISVRYLGRDE
jgi:hypothetical protein